MSRVRPHHQTALRRSHFDDGFVAFCLMGVGYYEPIPNSDEAAEVLNGRHKLLYQMGGSWSLGHHHREKHTKLCMKEHYLQVQHTYSTDLRKQEAVWKRLVQRFLLTVGDQESPLFTCPPSGEQTSRGNEPILTQNHQDSAREGKEYMAGRIAKRSIGV